MGFRAKRLAPRRLRGVLGGVPLRLAFISTSGVIHCCGSGNRRGFFGHADDTVNQSILGYRPPGDLPVIAGLLTSLGSNTGRDRSV